jgi:hypothetical protein
MTTIRTTIPRRVSPTAATSGQCEVYGRRTRWIYGSGETRVGLVVGRPSVSAVSLARFSTHSGSRAVTGGTRAKL